jgi:hypothetical protein
MGKPRGHVARHVPGSGCDGASTSWTFWENETCSVLVEIVFGCIVHT